MESSAPPMTSVCPLASEVSVAAWAMAWPISAAVGSAPAAPRASQTRRHALQQFWGDRALDEVARHDQQTDTSGGQGILPFAQRHLARMFG